MKKTIKINKMLKYITLVWSFFLLPLPLTSEACTLEELMKLSIENRDLVKSYRARLQKSRHDINHAKGNFLPSLDIGYRSDHLGENDLSREDKNNNTFYTSLSLNLFSGFKDLHTLGLAKKNHEIRTCELNGIKQDIKLDVCLNFLEVYYARAYLKVTEDALRLYRKEYEQVKLKYKAGILKKNDQLKIRVEMDNALQEVLKARYAVLQAVNNLRLKSGTKLSADHLELSCFEKLPEIYDFDCYRPLLLKNRSEIKILKAVLGNLKIRVKMAGSSFYPRVDLISGYKFYDDCLDGSGEETKLSLNLSANIFDGFRKNQNLKKAKSDVEKTGFDLIELKAELENRLKNILLDFDASMKQLDVAGTAKAEALENLRVTRLSFNKGILTSSDILDAIYYLSRARFNLLDARVKIFRNYFHMTRMIEAL